MPDPIREPIRPVWLASYPRSGNTFLRIILERKFGLPTYSIYRVEGQSHVDPSAEALEEAPFLPGDWRHRLSASAEVPTPIKTHDLPEDQAPAIYIVRHGAAAIDSYFHYHKKYSFEQPSLTEVIAGACQFGSWSEHYNAWRPKARQNTLFLKYEELVSDPEQFVPRLSEFLGIPARTANLPEFSELKQKLPAFFRRGQNQDFLSDWSPGQVSMFEQLHGPAMEELGYDLSGSEASKCSTLPELASSASRLHRLYLQELQKQALFIQEKERLSGELDRLKSRVDELSGKLSEHEQVRTEVLNPLLQSRWVRWGIKLRALRAPQCGNGVPEKAIKL